MKNTTMTDDEIIILAADFREAHTSCGVTCDVFDTVGFARAILAASEQRIAELEKDAARLELLEQSSNLEIGIEDDDGDEIRVIYRVAGLPNDREWLPIGRGRTLREAIDAARTAQ